MQGTHISYPASAAAVVFGVYLSAQSRLTGIERKSPAPDSHRGPPLRVASYVMHKLKKRKERHRFKF